MGRNPEPDDCSIYTLRRRIPTRPTNEHQARQDQNTSVPKPGQHSASPTGLNALISRFLPTVRLGH